MGWKMKMIRIDQRSSLQTSKKEKKKTKRVKEKKIPQREKVWELRLRKLERSFQTRWQLRSRVEVEVEVEVEAEKEVEAFGTLSMMILSRLAPFQTIA